jgi:hypothetical protein
MKHILGSNPLTSIAGYLVAGLMVVQTALAAGNTNWLQIATAAAIAILGRVSGDSENSN